MSSHREAPEISKDPVADNTDVYAFVTPGQPDTVTLIANFIPLQEPSNGPNFYEFGNDVLYSINVSNDGNDDDVSYQFRFQTEVRNPHTFLYNTGPIRSLDDPTWNRRQFYSVTRIREGRAPRVLASGLACPPCNIGPLSTPNYPALAKAAIHRLPGGSRVFAGQRADGFYVDTGAIFDLGDLRPFEQLHAQYGLDVFSGPAPGVNALRHNNVHSIALQVPATDLSHGGRPPTDPAARSSVIGVYATASRRKVIIRGSGGDITESGPWQQVSRLANPLVNEVLIPMGKKDDWNSRPPFGDSIFDQYIEHPELSKLLPALYPGVFPHLAKLDASGKPRTDLLAILHTGIPAGIIPGFQNYTGPRHADLMRLNMAIPPARHPNILGVIGGDLAGFPNGRRVEDDVVTIELRALAGITYPLVAPHFNPDAAASKVTDGLTPANSGEHYLGSFPYLGEPHSGFYTPSK